MVLLGSALRCNFSNVTSTGKVIALAATNLALHFSHLDRTPWYYVAFSFFWLDFCSVYVKFTLYWKGPLAQLLANTTSDVRLFVCCFHENFRTAWDTCFYCAYCPLPQNQRPSLGVLRLEVTRRVGTGAYRQYQELH